MRTPDDSSLNELATLAKRKPGPFDQDRLMRRLLCDGHAAAQCMLAELYEEQNTPFVELAVKVLYKSRYDYAREVESLIRSGPRRAYLVSLLCLILGMRREPHHAQLLWDYYCMLRERFPLGTYANGPATGLWEIASGAKRQTGQRLGDP